MSTELGNCHNHTDCGRQDALVGLTAILQDLREGFGRCFAVQVQENELEVALVLVAACGLLGVVCGACSKLMQSHLLHTTPSL